MSVIIYCCDKSGIPIYKQHNMCAQYCARYGYSINERLLDFSGNEFYKAVDKVVFDDTASSLIVYDQQCIGDHDDALFYKIYLEKFGKKLIFCN